MEKLVSCKSILDMLKNADDCINNEDDAEFKDFIIKVTNFAIKYEISEYDTPIDETDRPYESLKIFINTHSLIHAYAVLCTDNEYYNQFGIASIYKDSLTGELNDLIKIYDELLIKFNNRIIDPKSQIISEYTNYYMLSRHLNLSFLDLFSTLTSKIRAFRSYTTYFDFMIYKHSNQLIAYIKSS